MTASCVGECRALQPGTFHAEVAALDSRPVSVCDLRFESQERGHEPVTSVWVQIHVVLLLTAGEYRPAIFHQKGHFSRKGPEHVVLDRDHILDRVEEHRERLEPECFTPCRKHTRYNHNGNVLRDSGVVIAKRFGCAGSRPIRRQNHVDVSPCFGCEFRECDGLVRVVMSIGRDHHRPPGGVLDNDS